MKLAFARWGLLGLVIGFVLVGAIVLGLTVWARRDGVLAIHSALADAKPWLLIWRLMLYSVLMTFWREIMEWLSQYLAVSTRAQAQLVGWRWRAGMGLLLMDLILVEDLLGVLHDVFF